MYIWNQKRESNFIVLSSKIKFRQSSFSLFFYTTKRHHFISTNNTSDTMRSLFFTFGWGESSVNVRLSGSTCCLLEKEKQDSISSNSFYHLTYTTTKPRIFFVSNCSGSFELLTDKTWCTNAGPWEN